MLTGEWVFWSNIIAKYELSALDGNDNLPPLYDALQGHVVPVMILTPELDGLVYGEYKVKVGYNQYMSTIGLTLFTLTDYWTWFCEFKDSGLTSQNKSL